MFAPQYFNPSQPLMQGYIQQVPIFQTPDHGQKRDLSPLLGSNHENVGKRSRHQSGEEGSITGSPNASSMDVFTIQDVMKELKKLATKEDLVQIKGSMVAQSAEIQQLRGEIEKQGERIKVLEDVAGARAAQEASRTHKPDVYTRSRNQDVGPHKTNLSAQNRKLNVVIHGLKVNNEENLMEDFLDMCQAMNAIVFASDIDDIMWLGRYESDMVKPPPLRVTFQHQYMRDSILRKKSKLLNNPKYSSVYINPDEPIEVRRIKGMFRRIANRAKMDGKSVSYRADWIKIDEDMYQASEISRIPKEYLLNETREGPRRSPLLAEASGGLPDLGKDNEKVENIEATENKEGAVAREVELPDCVLDPNVNIMLTKSGLVFQGETAFISNFSRCDFVYKNQPYTSTEQGLQHQNALHHEVTDIAQKILDTTDAKTIKDISHDIPKSEAWNKKAPGVLWDLNDCKYTQNPPLLKKLIATSPHRLVEGTLDSKWGGGAHYGADTYNQGIVPGKNLFGDMATSYRDQKIAQNSLINALV